MTLASRGTLPIEVVDYDRDWPRRYAEERDRIAAAIGDSALAIEHVGGTAVPGLPAKPVIDLMIGVDDIERAGPAVAGLINLGYEYIPEFESQLPDRRYFRRGTPDTHHVHMVPVSSDYFTEHLLFPDEIDPSGSASTTAPGSLSPGPVTPAGSRPSARRRWRTWGGTA